MREIDADFTAYVRAWQLPLTQAAYLVCGDSGSAEAAVHQAFVGLALHWEHVRRDDPSAYVRRVLFREALSSASTRWRIPRPGASRPADSSDPPHHDTTVAVWQLTPRQRAVAVLRCLDQRSEGDTSDILGLDDATVSAELHAALARLDASLPRAPNAGHGAAAGRSRAAVELLRSACAGVREVDHAGQAWEAAQRRRTQVRRRVTAAIAAAALVLAGVTAVAETGSETMRPESRTLTPLPSALSLWQMSTGGTAYVVAPPLGVESTAPALDSGLPSVIDPSVAVRRASEAGFGRPSVFADAVYLQRVSPGHWQPVLVWRTGEQLVVDTVQLTDVRTRSGQLLPPLGVHSFSNDRTAIAFPQPGRIVVLRTATGTVESIPVPSPWLERVWWFGGWLMTGDAAETWQISATPDRHATPLPEAYGLLEYRADNGIPVLDDHVPYQRPTLVGWPLTRPYGATIRSADRVASAFYVDGVAGRGIDAVSPKHVIVATEGNGRQRMLVLGEEVPRPKGCCPVLGWTVEADLVYSASGPDGTWIMGWNVETGQVRRLSHWLTSDDVPPVMALGVRFTAG